MIAMSKFKSTMSTKRIMAKYTRSVKRSVPNKLAIWSWFSPIMPVFHPMWMKSGHLSARADALIMQSHNTLKW